MTACELSVWLPKIFLRITGKPGMPNIMKQGNTPFIKWLLVSNLLIYFQRYIVFKISRDLGHLYISRIKNLTGSSCNA